MIEEKTIWVDVKSDCLRGMLRFLEVKMPPEEILVLALHVEDCFHCREYIRSVSSLLASRREIVSQLKEGGLEWE